MKTVLLEVGKSLLIFGNLGAVLLFLREFFISNNNQDLIYGILFFLGFYILGSFLIYFSQPSKG
jgi:hypothetical protein